MRSSYCNKISGGCTCVLVFSCSRVLRFSFCREGVDDEMSSLMVETVFRDGLRGRHVDGPVA